MEDLISRSKAIKELEKIDLYKIDCVGKLGVLKSILALERLPSAVPTAYDKGYEDGYDKGYDKGYDEGYDIGRSELKEEQWEDGRDRLD